MRGVITYPCPWFLLLALHSSYNKHKASNVFIFHGLYCIHKPRTANINLLKMCIIYFNVVSIRIRNQCRYGSYIWIKSKNIFNTEIWRKNFYRFRETTLLTLKIINILLWTVLPDGVRGSVNNVDNNAWHDVINITMTSIKLHGVSNHWQPDCLFYGLFKLAWLKTLKTPISGSCEGIPPVTGGFPSQRSSNAKVIPWRHLSRFLDQISPAMYETNI